jgi:hypothetical protein
MIDKVSGKVAGPVVSIEEFSECAKIITNAVRD